MINSKFETLAIRTQLPRTHQNEHSVPLYLTSSFVFNSADHAVESFQGANQDNIYSRFSNPNTSEFIDKLKLLEGAEAGVASSSGMSAVYACFASLLDDGDQVISSNKIFGNTKYILDHVLPKRNISVGYFDSENVKDVPQIINDKTKLVYLETPSNPTLDTVNIEYLATICKANNIILIVDNCFATPYLQQPIKFGADLVIHSATKYLDGQGRVLGGAIVGNKMHVEKCYEFLRRTGACLSPFNAWVLSKSLETLAVRMDRHCFNTDKLFEYFLNHSDIEKIKYPFDPNSDQYELATKQMLKGGGLIACNLRGGIDRAKRFLDNLQLHSLTANLGDTRSIATHPASTTHSKLTTEQKNAVGITDGFIRFSVGLEHIDDIIKDIDQALIKSK